MRVCGNTFEREGWVLLAADLYDSKAPGKDIQSLQASEVAFPEHSTMDNERLPEIVIGIDFGMTCTGELRDLARRPILRQQ